MRHLSLLLTGLALFAAGCGDDDKNTAATATTATTEATAAAPEATGGSIATALTEYAIAPAQASAKAGSVTFSGDNQGKIPHELVVLKTDTKAGDLQVADGKATEEGDNMGEAEDIAPGAAKELKVDLEPGHYILLCNIPSHYEQGMRADFTVE